MLKLVRNIKSKAAAPFIALALSMAALPAFAGGGGLDVTAVVAAIGEAAVPIAAIGSAVLVVMVGIKVWKWIRRAM